MAAKRDRKAYQADYYRRNSDRAAATAAQLASVNDLCFNN